MSRAKKKPAAIANGTAPLASSPTMAPIRIAELVGAEYNPRKIKDRALDGLDASLHRFGLVEPIVWNRRTRRVVGGHQRLKVLMRAGAKDTSVSVVDLSPEDERALNLTLNNPAIAGEFTDAASGMLAEIQVSNEALYSSLRLDDLQATIAKILAAEHDRAADVVVEDVAPEPPAKPTTKPGDLYRLGHQRLLCGDSTKPEDVARVMSGAKAVLLDTDAPYGVDYTKVKDGIPGSGFTKIQARVGSIENDDLVDGPALQAFLERMIRAALPHLRKTAAFYFWHPMLTQGTFFAAAAAAAADILIHRQIIWVKPHMVLTRSGQYHWRHELAFYGWIRGHPPPWYGDKSQTSVWDLSHDGKDRVHPTQKPIELFARPLRNHSRAGEVCYEPFSGSGSQLIAAEQLGRRCYAIEIDPRYCDVAVARWETLTGKKAKRERA